MIYCRVARNDGQYSVLNGRWNRQHYRCVKRERPRPALCDFLAYSLHDEPTFLRDFRKAIDDVAQVCSGYTIFQARYAQNAQVKVFTSSTTRIGPLSQLIWV